MLYGYATLRPCQARSLLLADPSYKYLVRRDSKFLGSGIGGELCCVCIVEVCSYLCMLPALYYMQGYGRFDSENDCLATATQHQRRDELLVARNASGIPGQP